MERDEVQIEGGEELDVRDKEEQEEKLEAQRKQEEEEDGKEGVGK